MLLKIFEFYKSLSILKKLALYLFILAILIGGGFGAWTYFKPHQNIWKAKPIAVMSAQEVMSEFGKDADAINEKWIGNVIQINGEIAKVSEQSGNVLVVFDEGGDFIIQAYLNEEQKQDVDLKKGNTIQLKGRYVGWVLNDEDFLIPADIKLEQCYIIP